MTTIDQQYIYWSDRLDSRYLSVEVLNKVSNKNLVLTNMNISKYLLK